ncbi:hypothetical protein B9Z55_007463 [Caenorhabditis nigoni]|uniref:Uncharacterized protein n=1 Tax=Caenorhabditis nigoni TaxID=1611254 RepID=A0A2G5V9R2_9PELO|nr:hypothetical protein B9Z55_007463 [Caenorhabditis nigoni]
MTPITATQLDNLLNEAEKLLNAENEKLKKAIRDQKRANGLKRLAIRQEAEEQWNDQQEVDFSPYIFVSIAFVWMIIMVIRIIYLLLCRFL